MTALAEFRDRMLYEWLAPFSDRRGYEQGGFVWGSLDKLSEADARHFMDAVDSGLVTHQAGVFRAACSKANEYLFWEGAASVSPRRLTLWLEPVITIADLRRMQLGCDFQGAVVHGQPTTLGDLAQGTDAK